MSTARLLRLPVSAPDGDLFAHLFVVRASAAEQIGDTTGQELLDEVVAELAESLLAEQRTVVLPVILPGLPQLLSHPDLGSLESVEVAFAVPYALLAEDAALEGVVRDQRGRGRTVLVSGVDAVPQAQALRERADGVVLDAAVLELESAVTLVRVAAAARLVVLVTGVGSAEDEQTYIDAGVTGIAGATPREQVASAEPDDPPRQAAEAEPEDAIPAAQPTAPAGEHPEPEGERALLPPRKVNVERLLRLLAVEKVAMEAVDELIAGDAGLALGLLEVARTVPPGGPAPDLSSIRKALLHVTRSNVRLWAAHLEQAPFADRHERETSSMVLIRAHFCQGLAVLTGAVDHEEAFLAGLLAGVVDLMGIHAVAVLERYAASPEVAGALVDGTGPLAGIVAVARAHGTSGTAAHQAKLSPLEVMRAYLDAVSTTSRTMRTADGEESDTDPVVARPGQGELRRRLRASRD